MRLFLTLDDHFNFLTDCVLAKPQSVIIGTYGIWAGIAPGGANLNERFKTRTRDLLELMRPIKDVRILVGLYEFKSCKGRNNQCYDCERKYVLDIIRHMSHAEHFPEFKWRVAQQSHVKCALFLYPESNPAPFRGVAGGRNFTDSSWADVTVELDKMSILRLQEHVASIWDSAKTLNDATLGKFLEDQGISQKTVNRIMSE